MIPHRHAPRPHRTSLLFTAGALLLPATAGAALRVTLEKIAEAPATTEFGRQLSAPWLAGGAVCYSRTVRAEDVSLWGIYRGGTQIASWGGDISGSEVNNLNISDADGSNLLIAAFSNHSLAANTFKGSLNISTGGAPSRILSVASALPGYPAPHPGNPITGRASIGGSTVAFFINPYQFSTPPTKGAMAVTSLSGSPVTIIAQEGGTVPNSGGVFNAFEITARPYVNGASVVFPGSGTLRKGIYEWNGGALSTVVDTSMARPEGGTFSSATFAGNVIAAGNDYAFTTGTSFNAFYKKTGGVFSLVASNATAIPGGSGVFHTFASPSLRNGKVAFIGLRDNQFAPPREYGIYTDLTGTIEPIVDLRTDFGYTGKTVSSFEMAPGKAWTATGTLYFNVIFTDKTEAIFRATFAPAPSSLASTTVFTGPRRGTITFPTQTGSTYTLRRTTNFQTSTVVSTLPGNGAQRSLSFDDSATAAPRAFFYVEQTTP